MKTEFEVWVVLKRGTKPLEKLILQGELQSVLLQATRKLRSMGAQVVEARNLTRYKKLPSLLVHAPSFPIAIIITGAQLTDAEGVPLSGENATTGFSPVVPPISE